MSARTFTVCMLTLSLVAAFGCSRGPSRINPPSISASSAGSEALAMYDANKDGKIGGEELDKCGALKAALKQIDADGDGAITADEISARIESWQKSKLGRMALSCTILRNGRPLPDAEVQFVPEKFLGDNVQIAKGKTDANGVAMITVENITPPGIAPGLYRVEVAKAGENIPAKYNTETTLGQEVALDAAGIQTGIQFNLKY